MWWYDGWGRIKKFSSLFRWICDVAEERIMCWAKIGILLHCLLNVYENVMVSLIKGPALPSICSCSGSSFIFRYSAGKYPSLQKVLLQCSLEVRTSFQSWMTKHRASISPSSTSCPLCSAWPAQVDVFVILRMFCWPPVCSVQEAPLSQDLPRPAAEGAGGGQLSEPADPLRHHHCRHHPHCRSLKPLQVS